MKKHTWQLIAGIFLGLLMPLLGIWIMIALRPELAGIQRFDSEIVKMVNVQIITLGMLINTALFFVFIHFHKEQVSRGILLISVLELVLIFIYRFLL